jgi:LytS/YehU family sensor histidine kinase
VAHDPRVAEECLDRLGELLRYTLDEGAAEEVTLSEEWRFVRHYLALEQVRLGARLEVAMEAEERALDCLVPSFILQPLVENAIRHGVARRVAGGRVAVRVRIEGDDLLVDVEDNGPGTGQDAASGSRGLGLRALRGRLEALQGGSGSLRLHTAPGAGFTANVRLPARRASRALSA